MDSLADGKASDTRVLTGLGVHWTYEFSQCLVRTTGTSVVRTGYPDRVCESASGGRQGRKVTTCASVAAGLDMSIAGFRDEVKSRWKSDRGQSLSSESKDVRLCRGTPDMLLGANPRRNQSRPATLTVPISQLDVQ